MKNIKIIRTVYFDYELLQKMQVVSEKLGVSRSKLVNDAIREYLIKKGKYKK